MQIKQDETISLNGTNTAFKYMSYTSLNEVKKNDSISWVDGEICRMSLPPLSLGLI